VLAQNTRSAVEIIKISKHPFDKMVVTPGTAPGATTREATTMSRTLRWHRGIENSTGGTETRAWATELDPSATMPPYYRIAQIQRSQPVRMVELINCVTCGGDRIEVCVESNLAAAKIAARNDYDERLAQQSNGESSRQR
jgi:hypothetical protein